MLLPLYNAVFSKWDDVLDVILLLLKLCKFVSSLQSAGLSQFFPLPEIDDAFSICVFTVNEAH